MDFRKKLLALSVSAMAFAGVAAAQSPCVGATNQTGLPNILRLEGTNDLVTDVNLTCPGPNTLALGDVVVTLNANVTSKQVSTTVNEATLLVIQGGAVLNGYSGVISGNQITFGGSTGVSFPTSGAYSLRIANVRVNSSTLAIGTYVTETVNVYNQGVVAFTSTGVGTPGQADVGYVQQGFAVPAITTTNNLSSVNGYVICESSGVQTEGSFAITIAEKFGGAFKSQLPTEGALTCGGAACTETNGEQGSLFGTFDGYTPAAGVGTATAGTEFQMAFAGIPSGVTLYLPTIVTNGTLSFTLVSAAGAPIAASTLPTTGAGNLPTTGLAAITAANGAATAIYEVTATDNTVPTETISIPGYFFFAANFATVAQPAVTVTVTPYASGTVPSTTVPNFAPSSNPALTLSAFSVCQTSLLFPFVTNQLGFDTGMVIANTSSDPFVAPTGAAAEQGTCALNFYGAGAPNPSTGVAVAGGSQATGTTTAFQLSSVAPGFQGYVIATCNYLYAHGYAFIEYNLTQSNGVAEGYVALVITDRGPQSGAHESLGQ